MNCTTSRQAFAGLVILLEAPICRTTARIARRRALLQHRALSTTPRRYQQPAPKTPSSAEAAANTAQVANELSPSDESEPTRSLTEGLQDPPPVLSEDEKQVDWTRSFHGLSATPFTPEQSAILQQDLRHDDIEIKPDGIVYLPEIKYRRILNKAFGPGGWGLAPRGETIVTAKVVTREYGLVCGGRLVSIARGEQQYFDPDGIPTATEGCKSNALMRCCKDLGIASELWDPRFIKKFMAANGKEMLVEHAVTKKRRKHWMRKDDELKWPLKEVSNSAQSSTTTSNNSAQNNGGVAAKAQAAYKAHAQKTSNANTNAATKAQATK